MRQSFSQAVLGKAPAAVRSYFQQLLFSGRGVPPVEKGSDADVLAFVRANPGGVGYVSAATPTGDGVKVLKLEP